MINKSAAIIIKDRSVMYLRKKNFLFWILPGGKIETGESEEGSLHRELREELSARIKIFESIGVIQAKGFNKNLDQLEDIRLNLYRIELWEEPKISSEIIDLTYLQRKNIHRYLLTPVGIRTIEFLHKKGLID